MAIQNLQIKFSTDGLAEVKAAVNSAKQAYLDFLNRVSAAQTASNEAVQKYEKARQEASSAANRRIEASYQVLKGQVIANTFEMRKVAIENFEAIKASGVTSAVGIAQAYSDLTKSLKALDAQFKVTGSLAEQTSQRVVLASTASTSGGIRLVSDVPAGYVGVPVSGKTSTPTYDIPPNTDRDPFAFAPGVKIPQAATPKTLLGITGNTGRSSGPHLDVRYSRAYNPNRPRVSDEVLNRLMVDDKPLTSYPITSEHRSRNSGRPTHDGVDYGTPVGGKITTKVPVVYRSKPEWDNGGGGWITTVRFADGVEIVLLHQDPSVQEQIKKAEGGRTASTYQTQENQAQKEENEARKIIEQTRRRADERRQQVNEQQRLALEDKQKTEVLKQEQAIATMPPGGRKETAELLLKVTQKENQYALERLQIEQTIAQLKEERTRKLEDQGTGETPSGDYTSGRRLTRKLDGKTPSGYLGGRDYASAIASLEKRKSLLEENLFAEQKILAGEFEQKLSAESVKLTERLETTAKAVETLGQKFADDTPENRMKEAVAGVSKEFDSQTKTLDEVKKQLNEQVQAKLALNWSTAKEMEQLKQLEALYQSLNQTKAKAVQGKRQEVQSVEQQKALQRTLELTQLQGQIKQAQASQLESVGNFKEANALRRDVAVSEALAQQAVTMNQLKTQKAIATDPAAIAYLDALIERTQRLNRLQLSHIYQQYDLLQQRLSTISEGVGSAVSDGLSNLFNTLLDGTKSFGDAVLSTLGGIFKSISQMFLQMAMQMLQSSITKGLGNLLGSLFGGLGGAAATGFGGGAPGLLFGPGFASGGYTGRGGKYQPAGIVHAGEYVVRSEAVKAVGLQRLNALNAIAGYADGGYVSDMFSTIGSNIASGRGSMSTLSTARAKNGSGGGSTLVANINVTTPNPDGFRPSERQLGQAFSNQVQRGMGRK